MALVLADRVKETSTTTGTGSITLAGAVVGYQDFNTAIGNGNTTYYTIENVAAGEWETGLGTFTSPSTLARITVYASSNSGSAVSFTSGTKSVFVDLSATKWPAGVLGVANGGTGVTTSTGTGSVVLADNPTLTGNGTVTSNNPILNMTQTWNNAAVSFKGVVLDITSSAAYTGGIPYPAAIDVRNAGSPQIAIGIDGWFYPKGSYMLMGPNAAGDSLNFYQYTDAGHQIRGNGYFTRQGYLFGFGPGDSAAKTPVAAIGNPSNGVIEFNNGSMVSGGGSYADIKAAGPTFSAAMTYGGITLSNSVTGTGSMVLSTSPTITDLALAAGTTALPPLQFTSGTNLTTAAAGAVEYDGTIFYNTNSASNRGLAPSVQYCMLNNATYTLTSQTAAQKLFNTSTNGAITLPTGLFEFECFFSLSSMSATSGSFGFALGGSATKTQLWQSTALKNAAGAAGATGQTTWNTSAANTTMITANTTTTGWAHIRGSIRVSVSGTVIPQVSLGVAAAAVVGTNSYFKITQIGSTSTATIGNWS